MPKRQKSAVHELFKYNSCTDESICQLPSPDDIDNVNLCLAAIKVINSIKAVVN